MADDELFQNVERDDPHGGGGDEPAGKYSNNDDLSTGGGGGGGGGGGIIQQIVTNILPHLHADPSSGGSQLRPSEFIAPYVTAPAQTVESSVVWDSDGDFLTVGDGSGRKTLTTTANKLSDFAATTSAELAGVISNETGSGLLVFGTSPALTTPTMTTPTIDTKKVTFATSNPGSPATGDVCYRTDLGWWIYYDGTRWLTMHEYSISTFATNVSAAGDPIALPFDGRYAAYYTRANVVTYVATTNDGTNYWTVGIEGVNLAFSARTTLFSFNTSADTLATLTQHADSTASAPTNNFWINAKLTKTNAPGNLNVYYNVAYRLIVT